MKHTNKKLTRKEFEAGEFFHYVSEGLLRYVHTGQKNCSGYLMRKGCTGIYCFIQSISDEGFNAIIYFFGKEFSCFVRFDSYCYTVNLDE